MKSKKSKFRHRALEKTKVSTMDSPGILSKLRFDESVSVYRPTLEAAPVSYADGGEARILAALRKARDVSTGSNELLLQCTDFVSTYHLNPERANLLWPLRDSLRGRVLEVGAGCGAMSRFLGENGAELFAVEGSLARATACRERCRDLPNVKVIAANLSDLSSVPEFDAVLLIGVLEYSRVYYGGLGGPEALLTKCRELLKPGGIVVIAIENKIGLKYFAGAPEDHLGSAFVGLHDQYGPNTAVTFGKNEIDALLQSSGYLTREYFYPFPDYKFPRVVIHSQALRGFDVNVASVLGMMGARNQSSAYSRTFSEEMTWPVILQNGLAEPLANSFLIVASPSEAAVPEIQVEPSIWAFASRRRKSFAKAALFCPGEGARVRQIKLYPQAPDALGPYRQLLKEEPLHRGTLLAEEFFRAVNRPGWTAADLVPLVEVWLRYLQTHSSMLPDRTGRHAWLPGEFVDCVPVNLVRDKDGQLVRFDQEWIAADPVPLSFILLRGFFDLFTRIQSIANSGPIGSVRLVDILRQAIEPLSFTLTDDEVRDFADREVTFQCFVMGREGVITGPNNFAERCLPPVRNVEHVRVNFLEQALIETANNAIATISALNAQIAERETELHRMRKVLASQ